MIEIIPCTKFISELSTRRLPSIASRPGLTRRSHRQFGVAARCLAAPAPPQQQQQTPPPAVPEYTPSVKQIAAYAAKVGRRSSAGGILAATTETYAAYGTTEQLYGECARQCDYSVPSRLEKPPQPAPKNAAGEDTGEGQGAWFAPRSQGGLGLPVTFFSWAQVMYLHLYILTVRLRRFPPEHVRIWEQHLMDHFYYAAEDKMEKWHGMAARGVRNKNLKDLWLQWRGALLSYDEGLIKGDAMLSAAVWRAIFKADVNANIEDVAMVTAYLRQELQRVDLITDADLAVGKVKFGDLGAVRPFLNGQSTSMTRSFNQEDLSQLKAIEAEAARTNK
ncbi:hypothetical protein AMS68_002215 [Peltaster fructicola]|uniref:Ubiquinol-cytochrome c chaperone domain-containing protein n=1 Tax=Peltaster fructicola TaxID=286661 RepID=A0A6H0XPY7_9PEZI|nr:hypothetical protein AMS68_002215 [Peltaster fructicola]